MGTKEKCVIISSGVCMKTDVSDIVNDALIICADGGIDNALKMGVKPHVIIGDGDSMAENNHLDVETAICLPTEKDVTDTTACVEYALNKGYNVIYLLCCSGGRIDHMLSNIYVLEYIAGRNATGIFCDDNNEIRLIETGTHVVPKSEKYKYISLLPIDSSVNEITLKGLKYPLCKRTLYREFSALGVSNEFVADKAEITVGKGKCLLIRSRDN